MFWECFITLIKGDHDIDKTSLLLKCTFHCPVQELLKPENEILRKTWIRFDKVSAISSIYTSM